MTCLLCDAPAARLFANSVDLCIDHYQAARLRRLDEDETEKLQAAIEAGPREVPDVSDKPKAKRVSKVSDCGDSEDS